MPPHPRPDLELLRPVAVPDLVRLGRDRDGGYVVCERSVQATRAVVGLGINDEWSFEEEFLRRRPHADLLMVDGTVGPWRYRRRAAERALRSARRLARMQRSRAAEAWGQARSYARAWTQLAAFLSGAGRRLDARMVGGVERPGWVTWSQLTRDMPARPPSSLFVKVDVEGAEYDVLPAVLADGAQLAGLVIEFHAIDRHWAQLLALRALWEPRFVVVHLHANNGDARRTATGVPATIELTLAPRALLTTEECDTPLPGGLPRADVDRPNDPRRAEPVSLPARRPTAGGPPTS